MQWSTRLLVIGWGAMILTFALLGLGWIQQALLYRGMLLFLAVMMAPAAFILFLVRFVVQDKEERIEALEQQLIIARTKN